MFGPTEVRHISQLFLLTAALSCVQTQSYCDATVLSLAVLMDVKWTTQQRIKVSCLPRSPV